MGYLYEAVTGLKLRERRKSSMGKQAGMPENRFSVGVAVRWEQPGRGEFVGEVVRFAPAGTPFSELLPPGVAAFDLIDMSKGSSRHDRYVVVDGVAGGDDDRWYLPRADRLEVM